MTGSVSRHFGLSVRSDRLLPRSAAVPESSVDLEIVTSGSRPVDQDQLAWVNVLPSVWRAPAENGTWLRLRYADADDWVEFVIAPGGTTVWISSSDVRWDEVCELLLGPVFSCVLEQRGVTCLHAAVLKIDGAVAGFIGAKGAGKSTLSLALLQHGAELVSDDVAALGDHDGRPTVAVGPPRLRLRQDSAGVLDGSFEALRPVWAQAENRPPKRYVETSPALPEGPLPLDALYFLAPRDGDEPSLRSVSPVEAVPRLMADRHMVHLIDRVGDRRDFPVLARVAAQVRLRELRRPDALSALDRTIELVRADLAASTASGSYLPAP